MRWGDPTLWQQHAINTTQQLQHNKVIHREYLTLCECGTHTVELCEFWLQDVKLKVSSVDRPVLSLMAHWGRRKQEDVLVKNTVGSIDITMQAG